MRDKVSQSYLFSQNAVCGQRGENTASLNTLIKMQQKVLQTWTTTVSYNSKVHQPGYGSNSGN